MVLHNSYKTTEVVKYGSVLHFFPQFKLWANVITHIELTHNFSCGKKTHK